jgi:hypothetical protein
MPLFVIVVIPLIAQALPFALPESRMISRGKGVLNGAVALMLLLALVLYAGTLAQRQDKTERAYFPVDAVRVLENRSSNARLFNQYEWGGYLIERLYPRTLVFIDGRADVYGGLMKDYLTVYRGEEGWRDILSAQGIDSMLVAPRAPVVELLEADPAWQVTFHDDMAVLLEKR